MTPLVKDPSVLEGVSLKHGNHDSWEAGACVMEAASYIAGEPWSDHPACVSKAITEFMINWNDALPNDADRNRLLKPLLTAILDTAAGPEIEQRRGLMAMDWFIREHVPAWLDLTAALKPSGDALRALDEINTVEALQAANVVLADAITKAAAARAAALDAARAAGAAALAAALAAAGAAWAAGAAGDAARAASDAAWAAGDARDAARAAIKPTTGRLQASAQDLVRRMAAVGRGDAR